MSDIDDLKVLIGNLLPDNNNKAIKAKDARDAFDLVLDNLGNLKTQYLGDITPSSPAKTGIEEGATVLPTTDGIYTNFNSLEKLNELCVFVYESAAWVKKTIQTKDQVVAANPWLLPDSDIITVKSGAIINFGKTVDDLDSVEEFYITSLYAQPSPPKTSVTIRDGNGLLIGSYFKATEYITGVNKIDIGDKFKAVIDFDKISQSEAGFIDTLHVNKAYNYRIGYPELNESIFSPPFYEDLGTWSEIVESVSVINRNDEFDYLLTFFDYDSASRDYRIDVRSKNKITNDLLIIAQITKKIDEIDFSAVHLMENLNSGQECVYIKLIEINDLVDKTESLDVFMTDYVFNVKHFPELINSTFIPEASANSSFNPRTTNADINKSVIELHIINPSAYLEPFHLSSVSLSYPAADFIRLTIRDANNSVIGSVAIDGLMDADIFNTKVFNIYAFGTTELFGYAIFKQGFIGSTGGDAWKINVENTTLDLNPTIKAYLADTEKRQILLSGSSTWGYLQENSLREQLNGFTDTRVYNAGFGGTRMAWRTIDGSHDYDKFSWTNVVDALISQDFSEQEAANINIGGDFDQRLADLKAIDLNITTQLAGAYISNDVTGDSVIGDLWNNDPNYLNYDRTTFLGAWNYGVIRLLAAFPKTQIIATTGMWRFVDGLPPHLYTNLIGNTTEDYGDAIKEDCERLGVSVWDALHFSGRNAYNFDELSVDSSHFNYKGYKGLSLKLNDIHKNNL